MKNEAMTLQDFGETHDVAITVLVDNHADLIVKSTDEVKYHTQTPLLAEHGFSALVDLKDAGLRILWDAGITRIALLENIQRMKIDPQTIDLMALSHGHGDHTAAFTDVIKAMALHPEPKKWDHLPTADEVEDWGSQDRKPLIAHPAAFYERWVQRDNGEMYGPLQPAPRAEWEAAGADVILTEDPYQLGPGCWTTGVVPRLSFEHAGVSKRLLSRQGDTYHKNLIEDDQAIVINVKDKGLVVLSGCAHSGIVNTVNYAQRISGVDKIWAIIGGFHLAPASDEDIQKTIDTVKGYQPHLVVPTHCTGFRAIQQFALQMADVFKLGVVGATYLF